MSPRFTLTRKVSCYSRGWLKPRLSHHEKSCFAGVHVSGTLRSDIVVILEIRGVCNVMYYDVCGCVYIGGLNGLNAWVSLGVNLCLFNCWFGRGSEDNCDARRRVSRRAEGELGSRPTPLYTARNKAPWTAICFLLNSTILPCFPKHHSSPI